MHLLAATCLALVGLAVNPAPAGAASGPFTIDGTVPDAGATVLPDDAGNVKELGPKNASSTKIGVIQNAATPMLALTNPNAQVDLRNAWIKTGKGSESPTAHDWLYFAWERDSNSGSGFIAFEFMQSAAPTECAYDTATDAELIAGCNPWKNRQAGDFMILWDQSGSSAQLALRTWTGSGSNLTLGAPVTLDSAVSDAKYSADGFRGEGALDLTATIFNGTSSCRSFANVIPSTVTGNSDSADYKDTIFASSTPIGNCTSTTVTTPKLGDGTTSIGSGGVALGSSGTVVTDSALVSLVGGTATPAGSVAFSLCKVASPGLCTTGGTSVGSTGLSGSAYPVTVVSPQTTVTEPGRYCWRAVYSGDSAHGIGGSSDSSATECFTVNAVASSVTTAQTWVPNDSATISAPAGGNLAGTATFTLYASGDCTGTVLYGPVGRPVSGASPQTVSTLNTGTVTATGTVSWKVSYASTNGAQKDIPAGCHETTALTVTNGGTYSSP